MPNVKDADHALRLPYIVAATSARVVYGNERALRDALLALRSSGHEVELICRHEPWNDPVHDFFVSSVAKTTRSPMCEFPLRGYYLKFLAEFIPRYLRSNYDLFQRIRFGRRQRRQVVFLVGDSDALITYNLLLVLMGVPVVYRCGVAPPIHNRLRRILLGVMRMTTTRYIVDSNYMRGVLAGLSIADDKIEVVRPMPPLR